MDMTSGEMIVLILATCVGAGMMVTIGSLFIDGGLAAFALMLTLGAGGATMVARNHFWETDASAANYQQLAECNRISAFRPYTAEIMRDGRFTIGEKQGFITLVGAVKRRLDERRAVRIKRDAVAEIRRNA